MSRRRIALAAILAAALALAVLATLWWKGVILLNEPSKATYPVRGVDVSSYQGEIDWPTLAAQEIRFAFIKATEGSTFVDARFAYNYAEACKTGLRVGAYHFFSYDSPGATQAENYIATVPAHEGMLPPVVDVEFYGDKAAHPPAAEDVWPQLDALLARLEAHYGLRPILYATHRSYQLYLADRYDAYDLWIRSTVTPHALPTDRPWTFWQFTDKAILPGYTGKEEHIDLNVFCGDEEAFVAYGR